MPRYSRDEVVAAVVHATSYAETLRFLGLCSTGGNWETLKRWLAEWEIPTDHFDPFARGQRPRQRAQPLAEILVKESTYSRSHLKERLFRERLKERVCERCGQGEVWNGRPMSLILDHVNGVRDDHRLANLQIVCPNCAATLDTHCGRKNRIEHEPRPCDLCETPFRPRFTGQRFCSQICGSRGSRVDGPRPDLRRVQRPRHEQLIAEIEELGFSGTGRSYGVSDNAIRKWVRQYEREESTDGP